MHLWLKLHMMWTARIKGVVKIPLFVLFSCRASLGYIPCVSGNAQMLCQYTNQQPHGVPTFFGWLEFCGKWLLCLAKLWEFYCNQNLHLVYLLLIY